MIMSQSCWFHGKEEEQSDEGDDIKIQIEVNLSDTDARNVRGVNSIFSKVFYSTGRDGGRILWFYMSLKQHHQKFCGPMWYLCMGLKQHNPTKLWSNMISVVMMKSWPDLWCCYYYLKYGGILSSQQQISSVCDYLLLFSGI